MCAQFCDECCPHAGQPLAAVASASGLPEADLTGIVSHLYVCEGLSTYQIGALTGVDRQRVARVLVRAGVPVKPRGAGRPRHRDARRVAFDDLMTRLYTEAGCSSAEVSSLTGIPQRTVRDRLRARGVRMRTKGRLNREDRLTLAADVVEQLYVEAGLSAAETGSVLGVSRQVVLRAAHDHGLPVRVGGPEPGQGPTEIELVDALYADALVRQTLARHGVARRSADGPIWLRFPTPVPVSPELAEELYVTCGLGVRHIELLTGQPAQTMLRLLRAHGVILRPAGGRTPFLRRWRAGTTGGQAPPGGQG